ncbi:glycosyl hydrolase family 8 [Sporosarcina siberiensis]|uniref:Glycosyl hydrolase family 8 n=1 Tax=Sporosarcina siberiensis TaxID=1365606 RepID=A0ABW4SK05_9BACL
MNRKTNWVWIVAISLLIAASSGVGYKGGDMQIEHEAQAVNRLSAEQFVVDHLLKQDGRMRTNLMERKNEYLSETVGLWMDYLLANDDSKQFKQQVRVLKKYFLTNDYLVSWRLQKSRAANSNASIDDLRIMNALFEAGEKWNEPSYRSLAAHMASGLRTYQLKDGYMVDYIDLKSKDQGSVITLSYIIPDAFNRLKENEYLSMDVYENTFKLLTDMPHSDKGFFPKLFDVQTKHFSYDSEVNLIDQYYIGYHRAQWNGDVTQLVQFTKREMAKENGRLYGVYRLETGKPLVDFEAPSVYALAILMCLELDEFELAKRLFAQMKTLQQNDTSEHYYGGYIDLPTLDTHTFDNLLAMIAERIGAHENIF